MQYRIVSPHLDDAALSCGSFIANNPGSETVTVFANGPVSVQPLPKWDQWTQFFFSGDNTMSIRRNEDLNAMSILGASAQHLDFWDRQYRVNNQYGYIGQRDFELVEPITIELTSMIDDRAWLFPLGLFHVDHKIVAEVGMAMSDLCDVYFYEDQPYSIEQPFLTDNRVAETLNRGIHLDCFLEIPSSDEKSKAIACYESQHKALGQSRLDLAINGYERIWKVQ